MYVIGYEYASNDPRVYFVIEGKFCLVALRTYYTNFHAIIDQ